MVCEPDAPRRMTWIALLGLALTGAASAQLPKPDATVVVYPAHLVWTDQTFYDLDMLGATVLPRAPQYVRIAACGADAPRLFKATAHYFRFLQLDLQVLSAPECEATAVGRMQPVAQLPRLQAPRDIDEAAVDAWWQQVAP